MFKIKALNQATLSEDEGEELRPQEACQEILEEAALKRYKEGLLAQKDEHWNEAAAIYTEVLSYPVIMKAEPVENCSQVTDKGLGPLHGKTRLSIRYACYKNLAEVHRKLGQYEAALDYYSEALELDATDVTVWYRSGLIASKLGLSGVASEAFLQGIQCSPQNWPCLDGACICLYVQGDYAKCLNVISKCFEINNDFPRGYVLRDLIYEEQPSLKHDIMELYPKINLLNHKMYSGPDVIKNKLLEEVKTMRVNRNALKQKSKTELLTSIKMPSSLKKLTWTALGSNLVALRNWMLSMENPISLLTPVDMLQNITQDSTSETDSETRKEEEHMDITPEEEVVKVISEDEVSEGDERKGKKRPGSALMEELLWSGKRRSARVRSSRKEHEAWSVADALKTILPRKLLHQMKILTKVTPKSIEDESMDTMELYKLFEKQDDHEEQKVSIEKRYNVEVDRDKMVADEGYFGTLQEECDIKNFIEANHGKGLFDILQCYVSSLQEMWTKTWPKSLIPAFIECYNMIRSTNPLRWTKLRDDEHKSALLRESGAIILYLEFTVDESEMNLDDHDLVFNLHGLKKVTGEASHFPSPEAHAVFLIRFLWLSAHINLKLGKTSSAILYLNAAFETYEELPVLLGKTIRLRNCRRNNEITKDIVQATLAAISRKKCLSEVIQLYESEAYEEVKKNLIESFSLDCVTVLRHQDKELVDRQTQLAMLVNALHRLEEFKECVFWLEVSCHELIGNVNSTEKNDEDEENQTWKVEFDRLLVAIEECCDQGKFKLIDALPLSRLSRFVQTLCCVICRQLEERQRPPCASRPWAMLNLILLALEEAEAKENTQDKHSSEEVDLPPSVMILFTAHEFLGRREWCNCDGNVLLFLILDQVIPKLRTPEWLPFRNTIQQHLEQVAFCLYGHPNKKSKPRYITEHNISPIELTWDRAIQLFELFRPDEIPCFDSLRANIIAAETEVLLRRIAALIPDEIDPAKVRDSVKDYLYGRITDVPTCKSMLPKQVGDLFYIIGDYYVKTHESAKAVNYLLTDLCANPKRLDSWASVAFAKVYMLELQLNSCSPIDNEEFLEEAMAVTRCFEHCLKLDNSICTIWIEYGNFSYSLHSFCSQRMKLESDSLSLEQFEEIETTKTKMLETSKNAFMNANLVWSHGDDVDRQDERWLHHYMLGKICEKHGDLAYLDYYKKAADLLYQNNAQYPKKISYSSPQTYAIEALEIFYRIHVCVIKCLELQSGEPLDEKTRNTFMASLDLMASGSLAMLTSKSDLQKKIAKAEEEKEASKKRVKKIVKDIIDEILNRVVDKSENQNALTDVDGLLNSTEDMASEPAVELPNASEANERKRSASEAKSFPIASEPAKKKPKVVENDSSVQLNNNANCGVVGDLKLENVQMEEKQLKNKRDNVLTNENATDENCKTLVDGQCTNDFNKVMENTDSPEKMGSSLVVLNSSDIEDNEDALGEYQALAFAPSAHIPPNQPVSYGYANQQYFEPYPHEQLLDDNYYMTLDDFQEEPVKVQKVRQTLPKERSTLCKKRPRQRSISPVSSAGSDSADEIKYADDSSSSSSSSEESKKSRATSSSECDSDEEKKHVNTKAKQSKRVKLEKAVEKPNAENGKELKEESKMRPEHASTPIALDPEEKMLQQCLKAFETCALRFPQHYKSIYRLSHFFYRSKHHRDLNKCRDLLLGQFQASEGTIGGLFSERKNTNFFNGIWRLPAGDIDRPGSFASHMSRSILLLMEVLRDLRDHKLLFEMSLQLSKVPEPDKRYLREDERKQLSEQAFKLSLLTLRNVARNSHVMTLPIVLEAFRVYQKALKHMPGKEGSFGDCLLECFKQLGKGRDCSLDQCLQFCQGEISGKGVGLPRFFASESSKPKPKKPKKEFLEETKLSLKSAPKSTKTAQESAVKTSKPNVVTTSLPVVARTQSMGRPPADQLKSTTTTTPTPIVESPVIAPPELPQPSSALVLPSVESSLISNPLSGSIVKQASELDQIQPSQVRPRSASQHVLEKISAPLPTTSNAPTGLQSLPFADATALSQMPNDALFSYHALMAEYYKQIQKMTSSISSELKKEDGTIAPFSSTSCSAFKTSEKNEYQKFTQKHFSEPVSSVTAHPSPKLHNPIPQAHERKSASSKQATNDLTVTPSGSPTSQHPIPPVSSKQSDILLANTSSNALPSSAQRVNLSAQKATQSAQKIHDKPPSTAQKVTQSVQKVSQPAPKLQNTQPSSAQKPHFASSAPKQQNASPSTAQKVTQSAPRPQNTPSTSTQNVTQLALKSKNTPPSSAQMVAQSLQKAQNVSPSSAQMPKNTIPSSIQTVTQSTKQPQNSPLSLMKKTTQPSQNTPPASAQKPKGTPPPSVQHEPLSLMKKVTQPAQNTPPSSAQNVTHSVKKPKSTPPPSAQHAPLSLMKKVTQPAQKLQNTPPSSTQNVTQSAQKLKSTPPSLAQKPHNAPLPLMKNVTQAAQKSQVTLPSSSKKPHNTSPSSVPKPSSTKNVTESAHKPQNTPPSSVQHEPLPLMKEVTQPAQKSQNTPPLSAKNVTQSMQKPKITPPTQQNAPLSLTKKVTNSAHKSQNLPSSSGQRAQNTPPSSAQNVAQLVPKPKITPPPSAPKPQNAPLSLMKTVTAESAQKSQNTPASSAQKVTQFGQMPQNTPPSSTQSVIQSAQKAKITPPSAIQKPQNTPPSPAQTVNQSAPKPQTTLPSSAPKPKSTAPSSQCAQKPQPAHKSSKISISAEQKTLKPAHMAIPSPPISAEIVPPPAHKNVKPTVSQANTSKFSIDYILQNREITVSSLSSSSSSEARNTVKPSARHQTEALNLSPQKKQQTQAESEPEIIILDE